jgi:AGCS family alanine or glycine:cation symporter
VTQFIVPFMALAYIALALLVLGFNFEKIPGVFALIFKSAFGLESGYGAIIGLAVQWGVKRGIYSNEAGQGTGPHSAAAAEVSHPVKQGLVQAFSVYIDTLVICTATALMILVTGAYNVHGGEMGFLYQGLPSVEAGPAYSQSAIETVLPNLGATIVALALFFFCFTTVLAYYYMAETNLMYMNRKYQKPWLIYIPKFLVLISVMFGGLTSMGMAWTMGDIGVGMMAWLNIVAILIIQKPALNALKAYESRLKNNQDLSFDPKEAGIKGADFWE